MRISFADMGQNRIRGNDMDDLISRQTDCVLKEFGDCSYPETGCADCEVKENIRNALSAQWKCKLMYTDVSDTISRRAATSIPILPKEHRKIFKSIDDAFETGWNEALSCVNMLPPVQPDHNADVSKKVEGDCVSRQEAIDGGSGT